MLWKTSKKLAVQICPAEKNFEKLVRRITFLLVGTGLMLTILTVGVTGLVFYRLNQALTQVSEPLAPLVPLVRDITESLPGTEKPDDIRKDWGFYKQHQIKAFGYLKEKAISEANTAINRGRAQLSKLEEHSHRQQKKLEQGYKNLTDWWSTRRKQVK